MTTTLHFSCESVAADGSTTTRVIAVEPRRFVIAGWTGRDAAAIQHHIDELAEIGVPRPSSVPLYYRASKDLLTQDENVEVLGPESSGEAEPVLFFAEGEWWLTVGSDHTDRKVESYSVAASKQMCAKPIASAAWRWADIADRQDQIQLASRIHEGDQWVSYQQGTLASIRPLASLRDGFFAQFGDEVAEGSFLSCGTLGAIPNGAGEGIRPAQRMELSLRDTVRNRAIVHRYATESLAVVA